MPQTSPSSALGSVRYKLKDASVDDTDYKRLLEVFKKYDVRYFFYNGGNDSMDTCNKISKYMAKSGYEMNVIGVPKTIDNDLFGTDHCPGFASAAKYIATSIMEINLDAKVYDTPMICVIEVMGRNAGYIALWCGIANGAENILIPGKEDYSVEQLIEQIVHNKKIGKKHHIIINAEGVGHSSSMAKRIEEATGVETRATILGHMQRGGSPTCKDRVYASMMGSMAVELLCAGKSNRVVAEVKGEFVDYDIDEALAMTKDVDEGMYQVSKLLCR